MPEKREGNLVALVEQAGNCADEVGKRRAGRLSQPRATPWKLDGPNLDVGVHQPLPWQIADGIAACVGEAIKA
jgi:hypothetical protein